MGAKSKAPMAQPAVHPSVRFATVTIDGRDLKLAFSLRGIGQAEREMGIEILSSIGKERLSADEALGQFYAALKLAQPEIKLADADAMASMENFFAIADGLAEAYRLSGKQPNPPKADGTAAQS